MALWWDVRLSRVLGFGFKGFGASGLWGLTCFSRVKGLGFRGHVSLELRVSGCDHWCIGSACRGCSLPPT